MKLLVEELKTHLEQEITPVRENKNLELVKLHLYKHRFPPGELILELRNRHGLISTSERVSAADLSAANFFHGMVKFPLVAQLRAGESYVLRLRATGYVFSEESFVGWCKDFDFKTYPRPDAPSELLAPFDYEMWTRER